MYFYNYLQVKLYKDFMYDDDTVIQSLERSMEELKKNKLDHPGPASKEELPSRPFGVFVEPNFEQIVGRRAEQFTEKEKSTNEIVLMRRIEAQESLVKESQLSAGESGGLAGRDVEKVSLSSHNTVSPSSNSSTNLHEWTHL